MLSKVHIDLDDDDNVDPRTSSGQEYQPTGQFEAFGDVHKHSDSILNENKQKSPNKPCFNWFNFNFLDSVIFGTTGFN